MIFIQPTIPFKKLIRIYSSKAKLSDILLKLKNFFPNKELYLTDSGRSALALIIESLNLEGQTIALPAYTCDVLLPVLDKYHIKPIFLEIDKYNFQPTISEYQKKVKSEVSAVIVSRTYGLPINQNVYSWLKQEKKIIIEDSAHCLDFNLIKRESQADAWYFSFSKILPCPDGGLAVLTNQITKKIDQPSISLSYFKKIIKTIYLGNIIIYWLKKNKISNLANPKFKNIKALHKLSLKIINYYLLDEIQKLKTPYCLATLNNEPDEAVNILEKNKIKAERIWNNPIIMIPELKIDKELFPQTVQISQQIVCIPYSKDYSTKQKNILKQFFPEITTNERQKS